MLPKIGYCLLLLLLLQTFLASATEDGPMDSPFEAIGSALRRCTAQKEIVFCLENEAADALTQALERDDIPLGIPGLSLKRSSQETEMSTFERQGRNSELPSSPFERLSYNLEKILATRSVTFNLAELNEGRGKKKKMYQYIGVALATAGAILIPLKLKIIGWMAASALIVGKLALVIASLLGLKKLVSKPHDDTTHHVHYDGQRSDDAHYLAYNGQRPAVERRFS